MAVSLIDVMCLWIASQFSSKACSFVEAEFFSYKTYQTPVYRPLSPSRMQRAQRRDENQSSDGERSRAARQSRQTSPCVMSWPWRWRWREGGQARRLNLVTHHEYVGLC